MSYLLIFQLYFILTYISNDQPELMYVWNVRVYIASLFPSLADTPVYTCVIKWPRQFAFFLFTRVFSLPLRLKHEVLEYCTFCSAFVEAFVQNMLRISTGLWMGVIIAMNRLCYRVKVLYNHSLINHRIIGNLLTEDYTSWNGVNIRMT